ncbi:MAG: hypothetical protein R3266_09895, partial [Gemmatimonadota bacterium]|nr:hypothetical protein [Gemmatimonadota bacterium]
MTAGKTRGGATRFVATLLGCGAAACGAPDVPGEAPAAVREAVEACGGLGGAEKQECYETRLLQEQDRSGVGASLAMLEAVAEIDRDVARDGHVYTHAIGLTAYDSDRPVAEAFSECTVLFQSGCYHGVIQAHFLAEGAVDGETIRGLCEPYKGAGEDRWLLFQCLHGL